MGSGMMFSIMIALGGDAKAVATKKQHTIKLKNNFSFTKTFSIVRLQN